jgi:chromosome segregation ATPase
MSTAGKVLTVLVALATIGWIVLIAMAASLNTNYGKKVDDLTAQVEKLDLKIADTVKTANQTLVDVKILQEKHDRDLEILHASISKLEAHEAELSQNLEDMALQIQLVQQTGKDAEATNQIRIAEKKATEEQLAALRAEVKQRNTLVTGLAEDLKGLQADFIATTESNRELLKQLKGRSATPTAGSSPRVRPASFVR